MSIVMSDASPLKPEIRLAQAVSQFEADLPSTQKATFRTYRSQSQQSPPTHRDVMRFTAEIDRQTSGKVDSGRCFGPRLINFLHSVQQFAALGDVIVGGSQNLIACGVWTIVRTSLLLIVKFSSYFEKLSTLLMAAGLSAPRYQTMALLYPESKNLQSYLSEYFIIAVQLCHQLLKFTQISTLGRIASSLNDSDIKTYQSQFDHWANGIKEEANLLMAKMIKEEAQENSKFRSLSIKFSGSLSRKQHLKTNLRVLDACSTYDYETSWKQMRKIGNATLFDRGTEYRDWKSQETSCTLVYTGKLGSGKSVLLANLVDDLNLDDRSRNATVAYFFCRHDIPESLKAQTVVGSLARQLLRPMANLGRFVDETSTLVLDFNIICNLLRDALPPNSKTYFVLDGLDECDSAERERLILQLRELQQTFAMLLCVSIRLDPGNILELGPERFTAARLASIPTDNPDIEAFISAELESRIESKKLVIGNPILVLEIQDALLKGSQGMFLWVALQIQSLCEMGTDDTIRQALTDLPKDLPETFSRILRKSERSREIYQRRLLEIITAAYRPLTAEELREALSVVPGDAVWNPSRLLNDIQLILTCCGSLLITDEEEETIRLVHHSVKQFLLSEFKDSANIAITIDSANMTMADIVVTYLNYGVFETQLSTVVVPQIPTTSVPSQIVRSTLDSLSVQSLALKLLKSRKKPDFDMGRTVAETSKLFSPRSVDEFHFYSYAKSHWLQHILCIPELKPVTYDLMLGLIKTDRVNTNATDKFGKTPLSLAAEKGHEVIVKLLLEKGAELESRDFTGMTPLSWAANNSNEAVVKLLLEKGAWLESKDKWDRTALSWAVVKGHQVIVKILLEKGAELESRDFTGMTPLSWAASNSNEAVVKLLLEKGAKLESRNNTNLTPLLVAAANGNEVIVKLLLEKGAELESKDEWDWSVLSWAAANGNEAIIKLLLEKGANLESKNRKGLTPLSFAIKNKHEAIAKLLREKGAR